MSSIAAEDYNKLGKRLDTCAALLLPRLADDSVEHVSHYIEHGELEMAYESLVLSCIAEGVACDKTTSAELRSIGIGLNMESESVFEANFWQMAQEYFASVPPSDLP